MKKGLVLLCVILGFIFVPRLAVSKMVEEKVDVIESAVHSLEDVNPGDVVKKVKEKVSYSQKEGGTLSTKNEGVSAPTAGGILSSKASGTLPPKDENHAVIPTMGGSSNREINQILDNVRSSVVSSSGSSSCSQSGGSLRPVYTKDKKGLYDLAGPVVDAAYILNSSEYAKLDSFLRNLDSSKGVQIAVLTVRTLNGNAIEDFSMAHAEKWKLGQKGVDNGALLVVSMEEHALRIETGYGTEGALTDAKCAQIIRNILVPAFKDGKYGSGIISAVENMAGIITSDESLVSPSLTSGSVLMPHQEW